jgi:hypothetical protein
MIPNRLAGGIAAGALAIGILVGAAGTVVIRDATAPSWNATDVTAHMAAMPWGMGGAGMMGGAGWGMGGAGMMGSDWSAMHDLHHPAITPEPTR